MASAFRRKKNQPGPCRRGATPALAGRGPLPRATSAKDIRGFRLQAEEEPAGTMPLKRSTGTGRPRPASASYICQGHSWLPPSGGRRTSRDHAAEAQHRHWPSEARFREAGNRPALVLSLTLAAAASRDAFRDTCQAHRCAGGGVNLRGSHGPNSPRGIAPPVFRLRGAAPRSKVLGRPAPALRARQRGWAPHPQATSAGQGCPQEHSWLPPSGGRKTSRDRAAEAQRRHYCPRSASARHVCRSTLSSDIRGFRLQAEEEPAGTMPLKRSTGTGRPRPASARRETGLRSYSP